MDSVIDIIIDILSVPLKKWDKLKTKYKIIILIAIIAVIIPMYFYCF